MSETYDTAARASSDPTGVAAELDRAAGRLEQSGRHPQEGGLARAVVADERHGLVLADREVERRERGQVAVVLGQAVGPQRGAGRALRAAAFFGCGGVLRGRCRRLGAAWRDGGAAAAWRRRAGDGCGSSPRSLLGGLTVRAACWPSSMVPAPPCLGRLAEPQPGDGHRRPRAGRPRRPGRRRASARCRWCGPAGRPRPAACR